MNSFYRYRKTLYARERCQRATHKKRKLSDRSFPVAYDQEHSSGSISNLPVKGMKANKSSAAMFLHKGPPSYFLFQIYDVSQFSEY